MKAKTIKQVLRKKFNEFVASIDDETTRNLVKENTIITGGIIASALLGEEWNDFDMYFRNKETVLAVANYYVKKFQQAHPKIAMEVKPWTSDPERIYVHVNSAGVASEDHPEGYKYFEAYPDEEATEYVDQLSQKKEEAKKDEAKPRYRPIFFTSNAISLSQKVQLITRFYGPPEDIHKNYDFIHCTCYWTSWDSELVLPAQALEALLTKELRYMGSKYPICSLIRTRKFIKRGWSINAGQYLKMAFQVSKLDLTDMTVLRDQLVGVDSAYFIQVIDRLETWMRAHPEKDSIDTAYLVQIIDQIF